MVTKNAKERWLLLPAGLALVTLTALSAPSEEPKSSGGGAVDYVRVQTIVQTRCLQCHSSHTSDDVYKTAPNGILLETQDQLRARADKIHLHVVLAKSMPLANKTGMLDEERDVINQWLKQERLIQ